MTAPARAPAADASAAPSPFTWWDQVPAELATRTTLQRAGLRLPKGLAPVAWIDTTSRNGRRGGRYPLYARAAATLPEPRTPAAIAGQARASTTRRTCGRCRELVADPSEIVFRGEYAGHAASSWFLPPIAEPRVCWRCYVAHYRRAEEARRERIAAAWRPRLGAAAVFDFETTGLGTLSRRQEGPPGACAVIEVAVVAWGEVLYQSLVDPRVPAEQWEDGAIAVHGLRPADVAGAPPWPEVEVRIGEVLRAWGIAELGSWTDFEPDVLQLELARDGRTLGRHALPWEGVTWFDARGDVYELLEDVDEDYPLLRRSELEGHHRECARRHARYGRPPFVSLSSACARYAVRGGTHRAVDDSLATWALLEAMVFPDRRPRPWCAGCGAAGRPGASKRVLGHEVGCPVQAVIVASGRAGEWWRREQDAHAAFAELPRVDETGTASADDRIPF